MSTVRRDLQPEDALFLASAFPGYNKINGSNMPVSGLYYDGITSETAHWRLAALAYGSGDITVTVYWYSDISVTGTVVFEAAVAAITPNTDTQDVETDSYATAVNNSDTHLGTTIQRLHSFDIVLTGASLDSIAAADLATFKLARLPANASDGMIGDAVVTMVTLAYSDT